MAEPCNVAFGRYLKTLRERRGLSLEQVESLSNTFPEPIGKTYLSRCENGKQKVAFSKMIPLSRIYEVDPEVLVERMELDLELDRIGGPDTEGLSFEELDRRGKAASARGHYWETYGFLRDALKNARRSPLVEGMSSADEQFVCATISYAIIASRLGAQQLSHHELTYARTSNALGETHLVSLLILLSERHRELREEQRALQLAGEAVALAEKTDSIRSQAFANSSLAHQHYQSGNFDEAVEVFKASFSLFKRAGIFDECARVLLNLAQLYFDRDHLNSAKRALAAAERLAVKHNFDRSRALARILRGEIAEKEGEATRAVDYWRESIQIAKELGDRVTRFKAEFQLYRHSLSSGDTSTAAALGRLMTKRAVGIPHDLFELVEFKKLITTQESAS